ncbi:MAG: hypothetical protein FJY97_18070 [candidate division Zixibacteria bacterium]|nr:hypothetical protein [candidate division Zixibacteria bacterium]
MSLPTHKGIAYTTKIAASGHPLARCGFEVEQVYAKTLMDRSIRGNGSLWRKRRRGETQRRDHGAMAIA